MSLLTTRAERSPFTRACSFTGGLRGREMTSSRGFSPAQQGNFRCESLFDIERHLVDPGQVRSARPRERHVELDGGDLERTDLDLDGVEVDQ
ncbi:MAG: hypothetical protein Q8O67_29010 [Deltaproteobacteria bacterium]|nr:hypothetical protein [Deltaproteobacteria bacterium]